MVQVTGIQSQVKSYKKKKKKKKKMVLGAILLNTQHYKVLFTNPSARAGYDTRSIFKRSLTGLNSEFSFS